MSATDAAHIESDLAGLLAELHEMAPADAHAHATSGGAVAMLRCLPPSAARDDYAHALVAAVPGLAG